MKLLEASRVAPANSVAEITLRLTFLDLFYFKLRPTERLFFFSVPGLDSTQFNDSVLPNLKDSLALTLVHYLPLTGNLLWPPSSPKPILRYSPGDAVTLSVSESASDFDFLFGDHIRETVESRPLTPSLFLSHARASVIALSLTLFPNSGFCIGVSAHHAVLGRKSSTMFVKSWAHICKELVNGSKDPGLPPELSPVFDRTAIEEIPDARGVDMVYLRQWMAVTENVSKGNPRSLLISPGTNFRSNNNVVLGTFELTLDNIEKLRNRVMEPEHSVPRLSTFVLSTAYVLTHSLRAITLTSPGDGTKIQDRAIIGFPVDYRARLGIPIPANYIGSCMVNRILEVEEREWVDPDGFSIVAVKLSEAVMELDKAVLRDAKDRFSNYVATSKYTSVWVTGSARLGSYGVDFGWGVLKKVMSQSNELLGGLSLAESRDGSGGVEFGTQLHMQHFQASFLDGLSSL